MCYFNERYPVHACSFLEYPSKTADAARPDGPRTEEVIPLSAIATPKPLRISIHREILSIPVQEILFVEVFNWKCMIHRTCGQPIGVNTPLKKLAGELLSPSFIRCGRSFLVNLDHLCGVTADSLMLRGGKTIPVPRRERAGLLPYCMQFLSQTK